MPGAAQCGSPQSHLFLRNQPSGTPPSLVLGLTEPSWLLCAPSSFPYSLLGHRGSALGSPTSDTCLAGSLLKTLKGSISLQARAFEPSWNHVAVRYLCPICRVGTKDSHRITTRLYNLFTLWLLAMIRVDSHQSRTGGCVNPHCSEASICQARVADLS